MITVLAALATLTAHANDARRSGVDPDTRAPFHTSWARSPGHWSASAEDAPSPQPNPWSRLCLSDGQTLQARLVREHSLYTEYQLAEGWMRVRADAHGEDCVAPARGWTSEYQSITLGASGTLIALARPSAVQTELVLIDGKSIHVQPSAVTETGPTPASTPVPSEPAAPSAEPSAEPAQPEGEPAVDLTKVYRRSNLMKGMVSTSWVGLGLGGVGLVVMGTGYAGIVFGGAIALGGVALWGGSTICGLVVSESLMQALKEHGVAVSRAGVVVAGLGAVVMVAGGAVNGAGLFAGAGMLVVGTYGQFILVNKAVRNLKTGQDVHLAPMALRDGGGLRLAGTW